MLYPDPEWGFPFFHAETQRRRERHAVLVSQRLSVRWFLEQTQTALIYSKESEFAIRRNTHGL
jgi:hypothetical protein